MLSRSLCLIEPKPYVFVFKHTFNEKYHVKYVSQIYEKQTALQKMKTKTPIAKRCKIFQPKNDIKI